MYYFDFMIYDGHIVTVIVLLKKIKTFDSEKVKLIINIHTQSLFNIIHYVINKKL